MTTLFLIKPIGYLLIQFVEYGKRSQEPPHMPQTTTRSITPVTGSFNFGGGGATSMLTGLDSFGTSQLPPMSMASTPAVTIPTTTVTTSVPTTGTTAKTQQTMPKVTKSLLRA